MKKVLFKTGKVQIYFLSANSCNIYDVTVKNVNFNFKTVIIK